jgi:hypothetical protein
MFSDVHNRIHFTLSFPKDTTNHDDTSNTYIPVSNPRVRWNPNKASEYVQVLENDTKLASLQVVLPIPWSEKSRSLPMKRLHRLHNSNNFVPYLLTRSY